MEKKHSPLVLIKKLSNRLEYKMTTKYISKIFILCCLISSIIYGDDWPQWRGMNRDNTWNEKNIIKKFPSETLIPIWRSPIGPGYSGVTVAGGRVYSMDRQDEAGQERILCFHVKTGKLLWQHSYDCSYKGLAYPLGPRASVTIADGRAFAFGAMGHFVCLDAATGKVRWKKNLNTEYKIQRIKWGMSASPIVRKNHVMVQFGGSQGACVVAFHCDNGKEVWRSLDDRSTYSSPILINQAGVQALLCLSERYITAFNLENGSIIWQLPYQLHGGKPRENMMATPIIEGENLFICGPFDGSQMFRVFRNALKAEPLWAKDGRDSINPAVTTPMIKDGYVYGPNSWSEFCCMNAKSGEILWKDRRVMAPRRGKGGSVIYLTRNGDSTWIFNEAGDLFITTLSPSGLKVTGKAKLIEPTYKIGKYLVCWGQPAFADGCVFARNDRELICVNLRKK